MINKILRFIRSKTGSAGRSYFDYPAKEKKRIIKRALHESNRMQLDLLDKYKKRYIYE